jgi:hypothetical protein
LLGHQGFDMRRFVLAIGLISSVAAIPAPSASAVPLSAAVRQDVRCFALFAAAVGQAIKEKDDQKRSATSMGVMYFIGKLTVESPTLDLVDAVRREGAAMDHNPRAKDIGAACDAEFAKRGKELTDFGQKLQSTPQSSSSS